MELKRMSVILDRFENMSLAIIKELQLHYKQIQQFEFERDFESSEIERSNAKRLIVQLLFNLKQILELRNEIDDDLHQSFDERLEPIRKQIQAIINTFKKFLHQRQIPSTSTNPFYNDLTNNIFDECFNQNENSNSIYEKQLMVQTNINPRQEELKLRAEQAKIDAEITEKIANEIDDLNKIMTNLAAIVHNQHEMVDSIEEHIERSTQNVQTANQQLKKAVATKSAKYPFISAMFGGIVVGGPIGIAAGSAIAGVAAAVGGAFAGLYSGRLIKKKVEKEALSQ